jgi:hypothetical protein
MLKTFFFFNFLRTTACKLQVTRLARNAPLLGWLRPGPKVILHFDEKFPDIASYYVKPFFFFFSRTAAWNVNKVLCS